MNIILIGMPGAGKSTVGVILAKEMFKNFIDTDILIQTRESRSLQDILDRDGYLALRDAEERAIVSMNTWESVIATGGSAVYSDKAINHLRNNAVIVYLKISIDEIYRRIDNFDSRGIAKRPDQSFEDLFAERASLYERYAQITIESDGKNHEQVAREIIEQIR